MRTPVSWGHDRAQSSESAKREKVVPRMGQRAMGKSFCIQNLGEERNIFNILFTSNLDHMDKFLVVDLDCRY